ncbi:MAG: TRAP transporter substrate-binding protein DctP, partial [Rhizobiales bacterium]|nr:TRAP transporter substrate-binding protein DctP [Hyphomicrobiales bacterium]
YEDAEKLWDASKGQIKAKLEKQGLMLLYTVPWPSQGIYAKKELSSMKDMAGLKFRAYNSSTERLAQLAGMEPTQIEASDISTAFATGRVDAMITSPSTGANSKAWDFLSHYHHTQAWLPKNTVVMNKKAFMKLDEAAQKAVLAAGAAAQKRGWAMSKKESAEKIAIMKENGINIITPSDTLTSELKAVGKTMVDEWLSKAGDDGKAVFDTYTASK